MPNPPSLNCEASIRFRLMSAGGVVAAGAVPAAEEDVPVAEAATTSSLSEPLTVNPRPRSTRSNCSPTVRNPPPLNWLCPMRPELMGGAGIAWPGPAEGAGLATSTRIGPPVLTCQSCAPTVPLNPKG